MLVRASTSAKQRNLNPRVISIDLQHLSCWWRLHEFLQIALVTQVKCRNNVMHYSEILKAGHLCALSQWTNATSMSLPPKCQIALQHYGVLMFTGATRISRRIPLASNLSAMWGYHCNYGFSEATCPEINIRKFSNPFEPLCKERNKKSVGRWQRFEYFEDKIVT